MGGREQGKSHEGQEAPCQKGALLSQAAGAGKGGRQDRACPRELALTPFYKEDPEGLGAGRNLPRGKLASQDSPSPVLWWGNLSCISRV